MTAPSIATGHQLNSDEFNGLGDRLPGHREAADGPGDDDDEGGHA